jgi:hypothetical protein
MAAAVAAFVVEGYGIEGLRRLTSAEVEARAQG